MGVDDVWDGGLRELGAGDAKELRDDETDRGEHGGAAVLWEEGRGRGEEVRWRSEMRLE